MVFWPSPATPASTTAETAPVLRAVLGQLAAAASVAVVTRFHLHLAALTLSAAANPLVQRLRPVLEYALERDADEHAARRVGVAIVLVVAGVLVATAHAAVELYSIATGGPC